MSNMKDSGGGMNLQTGGGGNSLVESYIQSEKYGL